MAVVKRWKTLPQPKALPAPWRSGLAPVNGIQIYYSIHGTGDPVVMLHGGLGSGNWWGNQVPALMAHGKCVILIDSRGNGRSTRSDDAYSYELMLADTLGVLDYLDIARASFVGWSDGAIIGLLAAAHHGERVDRLFAFAPNVTLSGVRKNFQDTATFKLAARRAADEYRALSSTPDQYAQFLAQIETLWVNDTILTRRQLKAIATPTTIACGAHDEAIKFTHLKYVARAIPGAHLVILPEGSHFAPLQTPHEFNAALLAGL